MVSLEIHVVAVEAMLNDVCRGAAKTNASGQLDREWYFAGVQEVISKSPGPVTASGAAEEPEAST